MDEKPQIKATTPRSWNTVSLLSFEEFDHFVQYDENPSQHFTRCDAQCCFGQRKYFTLLVKIGIQFTWLFVFSRSLQFTVFAEAKGTLMESIN